MIQGRLLMEYLRYLNKSGRTMIFNNLNFEMFAVNEFGGQPAREPHKPYWQLRRSKICSRLGEAYQERAGEAWRRS